MMELVDMRDLGAVTSVKNTVPFPVSAIFKIEYAPVMELVDMRDLGAVTSVKNFPPIR